MGGPLDIEDNTIDHSWLKSDISPWLAEEEVASSTCPLYFFVACVKSSANLTFLPTFFHRFLLWNTLLEWTVNQQKQNTNQKRSSELHGTNCRMTPQTLSLAFKLPPLPPPLLSSTKGNKTVILNWCCKSVELSYFTPHTAIYRRQRHITIYIYNYPTTGNYEVTFIKCCLVCKHL